MAALDKVLESMARTGADLLTLTEQLMALGAVFLVHVIAAVRVARQVLAVGEGEPVPARCLRPRGGRCRQVRSVDVA